MANLYGSSPALDKKDFDLLFSDPDFGPDELKIYPCSLIESAELMQYYQAGKWQPYSKAELLEVVSHCLVSTPEYCRLTRVIRDIPSTDIVVGNKLTNFRELAEKNVKDEGLKGRDIRSREIRSSSFDPNQARDSVVIYQTSVSTEHFLQIVTPDDKLLAFLRLSLPTTTSFIPELANSAMIREVHVYGQVSPLGERDGVRPQHLGFGKKLVARAQEIAREAGFARLAVISSVGTREYYRSQGFEDGELYQWLSLR
jgi:elongator complex protein 3